MRGQYYDNNYNVGKCQETKKQGLKGLRYRSLKICIILLVGLAKILAKKSNAYQYSRTDSVAELHIDLEIFATGGNPD